MTPTRITRRVVLDRLTIVDELLRGIRSLPLADRQHFLVDRGNVLVAQMRLQPLLEILFVLGRHMLAEDYGLVTSEHQEIAVKLHEQGILDQQEADLMWRLAGYRNRLVHFEMSPDELYDICAHQLGDVDLVQDALRRWLREHPEKLDQTL